MFRNLCSIPVAWLGLCKEPLNWEEWKLGIALAHETHGQLLLGWQKYPEDLFSIRTDAQGPSVLVKVSEVVFSVNSYIHLCQNPFPLGTDFAASRSFWGDRGGADGWKREGEAWQVQERSPRFSCFCVTLPSVGLEGTGYFHQVNTKRKIPLTAVMLGQGLKSWKVCSRRIILFSRRSC